MNDGTAPVSSRRNAASIHAWCHAGACVRCPVNSIVRIGRISEVAGQEEMFILGLVRSACNRAEG